MQASPVYALAYAAWAASHGLTGSTALPDADPDGDGLSNMREFLAGTDPTNSASALRITSVTRHGSDILVAWTMGSGKSNPLQVASGNPGGGYATNSFADVFIITNTVGTAANYFDSGAATNFPSRFYCVRLVP